jgi:hypothetical protein
MSFNLIVDLIGQTRPNGNMTVRLPICAVVAAILVTGCGRKSDVPVGGAAKNIRMLALAYVQFAASNGGMGPPNQEALTKFLTQRRGMSKEDAAKAFISPRDNEPYEVFWGRRPLTISGGPEPPNAAIIIVEKTGAQGTRYVADGQMSIKEMSVDELAQVLPATASGK